MSMEGDSNASNLKSAGSNSQPVKQSRKYKPRSEVWKHFTRYIDKDGKDRARCNYCTIDYACDSKSSGTSNMRSHVPKCEANPANNSTTQSQLAFTTEKNAETGDSKVSLQSFRLDQKKVSGTKYITSNTYLDSISCIDSVLKQCQSTDDADLKNMAKSMTTKFNKYWGDIKKFNLLVFIASLFDPRTKLVYLRVNLHGMYGKENGDTICKLCEDALLEIFNDYKRIHSDHHTTKASSSSSKSVNEEPSSFNLFGNVDDTFKALRERRMAEVKRQKVELGVTEDSKTELDRYLNEEIEGDDAWFESENFTVLGWWKMRSPAFPILSLLARDILAIPISTVASESTFSTGGRVLDTFRSSLTPKTVEALICCQDWIRGSGVDVNVEENIENLEKLEEVILLEVIMLQPA
ncbi:hypothetical protein QVD17_00330 [Tagetes erecta]|uniref:BED-type domain-containing protein n=1 Tax=Tagetes erecta TaxID=13708 RepID=A0AAD8P5S0_TARER|nr:hypothetical protein QVD17_00330 [Tagetes erecta]